MDSDIQNIQLGEDILEPLRGDVMLFFESKKVESGQLRYPEQTAGQPKHQQQQQ